VFEVQTRFVYGWENVWTEDEKELTFSTASQAQREIDDHLLECAHAGIAVDRRDFRIKPVTER
jgi:ppGpp synthetase/RelA/SpoT-type nucleotidyltranferase